MAIYVMNETNQENEKRWGREIDQANRRRLEKIVASVPEGAERILDAGCGDGIVGNYLLERGYDVTGIDISEVALEYFKGKKVVGDITNMPFDDSSFDLVISSEVLEHIPANKYQKAIHELGRVAAKWIIVSTPFEEHLKNAFVKCNACGAEFHRNFHVRSFTNADIENLFPGFTFSRTLYIDKWRMYHPIILWMLHRVFKIYTNSLEIECPVCHFKIGVNMLETSRERRIHRVLNACNRRIQKEKARWIVVRYDRDS